MSEGRRRELEQERQAQVFARAAIKEFTRAHQQRIEEQAAHERWLKLSPEERKRREQQAAEAEHQRMQEYAARKEQVRQSHGGSLDSMQVTLTVVAYKSFLYGALILTVFSYIDIYKWIQRDQGIFPLLPYWAAPIVCLCLYVARRIEGHVVLIYKDFDEDFSTWKFLAIFLFSAPAVALSGLFLFGWIIDRI
jgi:hypothetical protein